MPVDESVADPLRGLLDSVNQLLAGSVRFAGQYRSGARYEPNQGSIAHKELETREGLMPVSDAYGRAYLYLHVAEDFLFSLSKLIDGLPPQFGYMPLARGVLETSSRAWWLLDPSITGAARGVRGLIERIYNLREELQALKRLESPETAQFAAEKADLIEKLTKNLEAEEIPFKLGKSPHQVTIDGVSRPSSSSLSTQVFRDSPFAPMAGAFYSLLSGGTHGVPFAVMNLFEETDTQEVSLDGLRSMSPIVTFDSVKTPVVLAFGAWIPAMDRAVSIHGWDEGLWRSWRGHIDKTLLKMLRVQNRPKAVEQLPGPES